MTTKMTPQRAKQITDCYKKDGPRGLIKRFTHGENQKRALAQFDKMAARAKVRP